MVVDYSKQFKKIIIVSDSLLDLARATDVVAASDAHHALELRPSRFSSAMQAHLASYLFDSAAQDERTANKHC